MMPSTLSFSGRLRDGRAATEVPVEVAADGDALVIAGAGTPLHVVRESIRVDWPLPGVPRTLALPDGSQIETDDRAAIDALFPPRAGVEATAFWLESRWAASLAAIPVIAGMAWLIVAVLLPLAADPVARMIGPRIEHVIGKQTLATLDRIALQPSRLDAKQQRAVEERFRSFVTGEPGEESYELVFRSGMGPNALALPGGIIIVTDDMVKLAGNDAELLAVLAHEIGHVRGRHAIRLILQDSGAIVLVTALAGDAASMTFLAAVLPTALLQSHYSRAFETEADAYAFAQLKRHGYSPQAFADMMRRLRSSERARSPDGVLRYFSTHPLTEERIERAEKEAASR